MLLLGVHRHGFGEWDQTIRDDPDLQLTDKIAPRGADKKDERPRGEKLNRRVEALLQIILEGAGGGSGLSMGMHSGKDTKKGKTGKKTKPKAAGSSGKSGGKTASKAKKGDSKAKKLLDKVQS